MKASEIKRLAKEFGADLVGIAPVERLNHLPAEHHPRTVSPHAKSVIVVGHRIMRGTLRGVEEGTNFGSTYNCFGFHWMEDLFLSRTVYNLACRLEEEGIEAIPLQAHQVSGEAFTPDYLEMAKAAGLGDIGKGGFFLTPEYGHRQRLAMILVDAELEGDEIKELTFCDDCRACIEGCPLGALSEYCTNQVVCSQCKNGASAAPNRSDAVDRYAAACGRACMVALENKIGNRFENKFRKRSTWSVGITGAENEKLAFVGGVCPQKEK